MADVWISGIVGAVKSVGTALKISEKATMCFCLCKEIRNCEVCNIQGGSDMTGTDLCV